MNAGKILAGAILVCAIVAGGAMYYLQIYHFYEEIPASGPRDVMVTTLDGDRIPLPHSNFRAIDADSSPIRYRACFDTDLALAEAELRFEPYAGADPRIAPGWFECFEAETIGREIATGTARIFTSERNREFGIDRVIALTEDGRGFVWHEVNECGDKAYDGTPLGDNCPDRDSFEKDP